MFCIKSPTTNPYFNIAAEEHLLKGFTDDIFFLYKNEPSVIIGKHQNAVAEIDVDFAEQNGIKIVRRLSGGGAVYHDLGNVNFCFVKNGSEGKLVDFKAFTRPVVDALAQLGVNAKLEGHNSLLVNGLKISGNAEHVFKNRVLHHGTLLFSTNLERLARSLYVDLDRYADKAVKSVRANVVNLKTIINPSINDDDFFNHIYSFIKSENPNSVPYSFTDNDLLAINQLVSSKYSTWEWSYGYSPAYSFTRIIEEDEKLKVTFRVEKGIIVDVRISDSSNRFSDICKFFAGQQHSKRILFERYSSSKFVGNSLVRKIIEKL